MLYGDDTAALSSAEMAQSIFQIGAEFYLRIEDVVRVKSFFNTGIKLLFANTKRL